MFIGYPDCLSRFSRALFPFSRQPFCKQLHKKSDTRYLLLWASILGLGWITYFLFLSLAVTVHSALVSYSYMSRTVLSSQSTDTYMNTSALSSQSTNTSMSTSALSSQSTNIPVGTSSLSSKSTKNSVFPTHLLTSSTTKSSALHQTRATSAVKDSVMSSSVVGYIPTSEAREKTTTSKPTTEDYETGTCILVGKNWCRRRSNRRRT